jgi:hypothetical protein
MVVNIRGICGSRNCAVHGFSRRRVSAQERSRLLSRHLPSAARIYLGGLALAASTFATISAVVVDVNLTETMLVTAVVLGLFSLLLEFIDFPLMINGDTSFSTVAYMAMIFMLPFPVPMVVGVLVVIASDIHGRSPLSATIFNASNFALTFGLSSLIWYAYHGPEPLGEMPFSFLSLAVILLVIAVFYLVNVLLTNLIIAIAGHRSVKYIWLTNDLDFLLPYICLEVVGILMALVWETAPTLLPLLVIPAVTTFIAFEMIHRLQSQTKEAMIAMADAIDRRDPYTADHSRRVAELAIRIADVHGMNERDLERLRLASRMHDIGKIGIGNDLLHKPGKLTDEEWKIMRDHPVIGEQLLKPYRQFRHETRLVRSHHERWDGKGYPDGLRGAEIPLGARMIAVADTFDAMTTSRPYRPALSKQIAIDEIRNGALTQFDPQVVASFLQVMEEWSKIRSITGEELPVVSGEATATAQLRAHSEGFEQVPAWFSSSQ